MHSFWQGYGLGFGVDSDTEYQRSALGFGLEETPALNVRGHLAGTSQQPESHPKPVTRGFTNPEISDPGLNVHGHLADTSQQPTNPSKPATRDFTSPEISGSGLNVHGHLADTNPEPTNPSKPTTRDFTNPEISSPGLNVHGHLTDTSRQPESHPKAVTWDFGNSEPQSLGLNVRGHLAGANPEPTNPSKPANRDFTNPEISDPGLNVHGHLVRHVRQDTDRIPQPLDFRLAIPAGTLWLSLLVASWSGGLDLVPSCLIAGVALAIALVAAGVTRIQSRKHRLYPQGCGRGFQNEDSRIQARFFPGRAAGCSSADLGKHRLYPLGSAAALVALAAFAVVLGFAGHAANLAIVASDPLATIGADPSHRFEIQAQVITTPRLLTHNPGSNQAHSRNQAQNQSQIPLRSTPAEFRTTPGIFRSAPPPGTATTLLSGIVPTPHRGFLTTSQPATATSQIEPATAPRPGATRILQTGLASTPSPRYGTKPSDDKQSYRVTLQAKFLTWRGSTYRTRAKLQVKGKGWEGIALGSTVRLRVGLGGLDPSGEFLGFVKTPGTPQVIAPPSGRFVFVNAVRARLAEASTHLTPETRAMIGAMSLGLTANQSQSDREAMQISGLSHLTAVSGLHLSVLLGLALGLTSRAPRAVQVTAAATLMVAFLCTLEGSASVTRAATMGTITLLGLALARPAKSIAALSLAVTGMLLVSPWQATSWGFALSVVATLSIVTLGQALSRWLASFLPRFLALPLAISLSAQLGCQPLMLVLRGKLQLFSLPANLLTGAISSVVTIGGLLLVILAAVSHLGMTLSHFSPVFAPICQLLFAPLPPLTHLTAQVTGLAADWILGVARFFSRLQGAEIPWIESGYGVFGLLLVTIAFLWLTGRYVYIRHWSISSHSHCHCRSGLSADGVRCATQTRDWGVKLLRKQKLRGCSPFSSRVRAP